MRPSVVQLRQFYSSRLGRKVKQRLRQIALDHWQDQAGESIVGVGYATPLLRVLERVGGKPASMVALMPADQGAIYWPVHTDNHSVLADELRPPFAPNTLHRVILMHAFEHAEKPEELLKIYWEMLAPGGRLLLVVPNRWGYWCRMRRRSPFDTGHAFRLSEIKLLLQETKFTLRDWTTALYAPPTEHPLWMKSFGTFEWIGNYLFHGLGGVYVIEAEKQIYAAIAEPVVEARKQTVWVAEGAPAS